jgi:6-pyruvoyltetrahydropterin/6-carboxytetrahydropterin synthase
MRVMREVRFSLGPDTDAGLTNSYAGWPAALGVHPYLILQAVVAGTPDARTGYLVNIAVVDRLLRERSIPLIRRMCAAGDCGPERILYAVAEDLKPHAPSGTRWAGWNLNVTPYLVYGTQSGAPHMLQLTQCFEFSAAHRLHSPAMSDEENRAYFGKCNNPNGHGHNYVLEVSISGGLDHRSSRLLAVPEFERIVKERVVERFDHKHLNKDCLEFRELNPSVENISKVIWNLLEGRLSPARLAKVRVWETPKTYAEYDGRSYEL